MVGSCGRDEITYANGVLTPGAHPGRLGQIEEHVSWSIERVELYTLPSTIRRVAKIVRRTSITTVPFCDGPLQ